LLEGAFKGHKVHTGACTFRAGSLSAWLLEPQGVTGQADYLHGWEQLPGPWW